MRSRIAAALAATSLAASGLAATSLVTAVPADAIVGGYQVTDGRFGFMASIQSKGEDGTSGHFCGGSVINQRWILTAAHCMVDTHPRDIQVAVGRDNLDEDLAEGQTLAVDQILVHPKYEDTGTFDAALIHVTEDVTTAPAIALAAPGEDTLEQQGAPLTVAGWGTEFFGSPLIPAQLKAVDVRAVADESCTGNEVLMGFQADSEVCAEELGGDSCQGDSGGPLFGTLADGRRVQIGIVSYGLGCATPGFPGVYGEVNNTDIHRFITTNAGLGATTTTTRPKGRSKQ
ncbi:peptidase S1 [Nocardioides gansuensis]|uniref:Peptidase S1 n=1 Tax=Nocardioides gansuensis TaxID=2138300 RepID=A0A2T8FCM3_9ACTN|nr:serine protease [Nocardioides gansuensis]PVG83458.1 peptidase S1 [Nocardioides gansuensis]